MRSKAQRQLLIHAKRHRTTRKEQQRLRKANRPELIEKIFNDSHRYAQYKRNKTRADLAVRDCVLTQRYRNDFGNGTPPAFRPMPRPTTTAAAELVEHLQRVERPRRQRGRSVVRRERQSHDWRRQETTPHHTNHEICQAMSIITSIRF